MLLRITNLYISLQCNQKQNVGYKPGGAPGNLKNERLEKAKKTGSGCRTGTRKKLKGKTFPLNAKTKVAFFFQSSKTFRRKATFEVV